MWRPTLGLLMMLALIGAAPIARGQEPGSILPVQLPAPEVPNADAPIQRLPFDDPPAPKLEAPISPNTGMPRLDDAADRKYYPLVELALAGANYVDPRYVANSQRPDDPGIWERTRDGARDQFHRLLQDYRRFYWSENLLYVGLAVGIAAPLANTEFDQRLRDGYQRQAGVGKNRGVDSTADAFKQFGEFKYTLPAYAVLATSGYLFPDHRLFTPLGEYGNRALRAMAVGAPMVGVLQYGLGAERPSDNGDSRWHPFHKSHAASGHSFVGAVPFLTAASMVENRALKAALIIASVGPAWSRIHHDAHYFSQAFLGWSMAYLAVEAVNHTEADARFRVMPMPVGNGMGMGVQINY